jgi:EpsI family protein
MPLVPDYALGIPLALLAGILLIVGRLGALVTVQGISLIIALAALVLVLFGRPVFRALSFPIIYLFLMVPIWDYPIAQLQEPSRLLSSQIATGLLDLTGVPALREGTIIALPKITLDVLRECSGVNQLIVIIAVALPAAYLFLQGFARRALLLGLAVIVAYLSNGFRIAMVGFLAEQGLGSGDLQELHLLEGLVVASAGYLLLGACIALLLKTQKSDGSQDDLTVPTLPAERSPFVRRTWLDMTVLVALLVGASHGYLFKPVDVGLGSALGSLPVRFGEWTVDMNHQPLSVHFPAIDDELVDAYPTSSGERRFMGLDDEIVRTYRTSTGERVRLYVGYHRYQREGKELTGEASHDLERVASRVALDVGSRTFEVNEVVQRDGQASRGIFYWYHLNDRVVADTYLAKAYSVWDGLTRRRTNGAVIMVGWDCPADCEREASRQEAIGFVRAILPILVRYLPT